MNKTDRNKSINRCMLCMRITIVLAIILIICIAISLLSITGIEMDQVSKALENRVDIGTIAVVLLLIFLLTFILWFIITEGIVKLMKIVFIPSFKGFSKRTIEHIKINRKHAKTRKYYRKQARKRLHRINKNHKRDWKAYISKFD